VRGALSAYVFRGLLAAGMGLVALVSLPPWQLVVVEAALAALAMASLHAEALWLPLLGTGIGKGAHHSELR